jgi:DNA repair protein SbcC/Rad50
MLITRVELQNIKSYEQATIHFTPGANAICGANGAGKSTILESIGFVLFDSSPFRRQADMVREGEKRGEITIAIEADDGREYEITRSFGSAARYSVHDPQLDLELAQGKTDVLDWLGERLGVSDGANLPALFSDAIGVPQGLLAAIFLEGRPERRSKFDRLLRVDEYALARDRLLETSRHLKERLSARKNDITALETRTRELPEVEQTIETLEQRIAGDERRLEQLDADTKTLSAQVERYDAQRSHIQQIELRTSALDGKLAGNRRQLDDARQNLAAAEQAAADMEASAAGHGRYEAAHHALERLEEDRRQRDALREQRAAAEKTLAQVESRLVQGQERLTDIEAAEEQMRQLQPAVNEQDALEREWRAQTERAGQFDQCQQTIESESAQIEQMRQKLADLSREVVEVAALRELAESVEQLQPRLAALLDQMGSARSRMEQARESRQAVAGGDCPFLGEPCKNMTEGANLADYFDERVAALSAELNHLLKERTALETTLKTARKAADRVAGLPQLEKNRDWLERQCREGEARIEGLEFQRQALADARDRAEAIRCRLGELGDPRSAYAAARSDASRRQTVVAALTRDEQAQAGVRKQLEQLTGAAAQYGDLDARIEAERAIRQHNQPDHEAYLRSQTLAGAAPAWQARVAAATQELADAEADIAEARSALETAQADYDPEAHGNASLALQSARAETAATSQRLQMQRDTLDNARSRREELIRLSAELIDARAQYAGDEQLLDFVQFGRDAISVAGPLVTRALVDAISREAGQIFSEIVSDHSLHLSWSEEYEIVVEKAGHARAFAQLSGGEQMAAAIAVRLALLREVSGMDIAFFDEPTANLDEMRRETLAEQIVNISGFSQIFVISHDDTFERATDHMVRVYKENGVSRVESQ